MREYIEIGSTPCEEKCQQVPYEDPELARLESLMFIKAIRIKLGKEPDGAQLKIKGFPHDFGTYHEVVCYYDEDMPESVDYAFKCESDSPRTWSEVGMITPTKETKKKC